MKESSCGLKLFNVLCLRRHWGPIKYDLAAEELCFNDVDRFSSLEYRWHLSCYKRCTHKRTLESLHVKFQKRSSAADETDESHPYTSFLADAAIPLTRSKGGGAHVDKDECFFCDKPSTERDPLHSMCPQMLQVENYMRR